MLKVSNDHLSAHEQAQRNRFEALAVQWYRKLGSLVPQGTDEQLRGLITRSRETANVVGIEDDETDRLRRLMVMHSLMPNPSDDQWLSGIDAVFDDPTQTSAIATLRQLANLDS